MSFCLSLHAVIALLTMNLSACKLIFMCVKNGFLWEKIDCVLQMYYANHHYYSLKLILFHPFWHPSVTSMEVHVVFASSFINQKCSNYFTLNNKRSLTNREKKCYRGRKRNTPLNLVMLFRENVLLSVNSNCLRPSKGSFSLTETLADNRTSSFHYGQCLLSMERQIHVY